VLQHGFHGRTYGALSATPQEAKQAPFAPLVPGFRAVDPTAEAVTAAIDERTAAVVIEPVQGESGVWVLPDELLRAARAACDEHGAALIFDEIQCGLARTGRLWAFEHSGVVPDALTTAKALGGGLPIGALVTGERLRHVLVPGDHGSTFAGGPVVSAAALAVLDVIDDERIVPHAARVGELLRRRLAELRARHPSIVEVRGTGLLVGVELDDPDRASAVVDAMRDAGVLIGRTGPRGDVLKIRPPLVFSDEHVDLLVAALDAALD
jgi:acetylornithine/N-succinyldiaminopimelate aminotransferase